MEVATMKRAILLGLLGWLALTLASPLVAQPFTYQGYLRQNGQPVNGTVSLTFRLYNALTGGSQVASPINQTVNVQNGLFTVELNFGNVWTGADRYLEIQVGSTTLSPRVKITPAPYASFAASAGFAQRPWQSAGSNIFYTDGNVGIGTSSPFARLSLGGGNADTKLAIWQGANAGEVMGLGVGPGQFRLHLNNASDRFSFLDAPGGNEIMTIWGSGSVRLLIQGHIRLSNDSSIFGLDQLVGYNDLRLSGNPNGLPNIYISSFGDIGIGTDEPQARLDVRGGNARFRKYNTTFQILPNELFGVHQEHTVTLDILNVNGTLGVWDNLRVIGDLNVGGGYFSLGGGTNPTYRRVDAFVSDIGGGAYVGVLKTYGANGSENVRMAWFTGNPSNGALGVLNAANNPEAGMAVDGGGYGVVWADIKNFRVPDPDDPTRDIWYGCLEGPELAMYVRGTARLVNGRARIELPDHFRKLADEQGMTVQLTPLSPASKGLCVVRKGLDGIEVAELLNGRGNYEFDWEVKAVRKEHRDFRVYRPWDEVLLGGIDPAEAWQARLQSIQERQARQQSRTDTKGVQR
jgi:hypothetical protein